jgi:hypothetical protein
MEATLEVDAPVFNGLQVMVIAAITLFDHPRLGLWLVKPQFHASIFPSIN